MGFCDKEDPGREAYGGFEFPFLCSISHAHAFALLM